MVADHYGKLGFTLIDKTADGGSVWILELDGYQAPDLPMQVNAEELTRVA
jgi:hypothetical protein